MTPGRQVLDAEEGLVRSCFTSWCGSCKRAFLVTHELASFPAPAAHHVHKLAMMRKLQPPAAGEEK